MPCSYLMNAHISAYVVVLTKMLDYLEQGLFVFTHFLCSMRSTKTKWMISSTAFLVCCEISIRSLTKASWARFPRGTWRLRRTSNLAAGFSWMNWMGWWTDVVPSCASQTCVNCYLSCVPFWTWVLVHCPPGLKLLSCNACCPLFKFFDS